ncbi:hypothetical protein [Lactobacillus phage Bassarid]|nr:hypothetical protein [Lactobacillus phage Bassarid]
MDLLVEKGNNKTYLSQLGFLVTSFEEEAPTIARNSTNIQGRSGSVDFGGWHESKKVKLEGFYRAEDQYEEETLKERLFALLSDPEGIYITEMRGEIGQGFERPGETEGEVYEHMMTRPSHKRFYVYASSIENELQGNVGGTVLYKMSVEFTTLKLPYGESVPRDLLLSNDGVKPTYGENMLINTGGNILPSIFGGNYSVKAGTDATSTNGETKVIGNDNTQDLYYRFMEPNVAKMYGLSVGKKYWINGEIRQSVQHSIVIRAQYATSGGTWHNFISEPITPTTSFKKFSVSFTIPEGAVGFFISIQEYNFNNGDSFTFRKLKLEEGQATPWSPASSDPEYNKWYLDTHYNTNNLVIPYAGTVPCNQLEQGFIVEFTARQSGGGVTLNLNGTKLTYSGSIVSGDVLRMSGYEYTKNGLSVVRTTNKAYFKLLPNVNNTLSASLHGTIKVLNFQNLYA